jgi:hypothetical protein
MQIRLLTSIASAEWGVERGAVCDVGSTLNLTHRHPRVVTQVTTDMANAWLAAGLAETVTTEET